MPNTRMVLSEAEVIVDERGSIVGFGANGKDVFFPRIMAESGSPVSLTGTTTETELARIVIPGGILGPHGSLRASAIWSLTPNTNNKTLRMKLGATSILSLGMNNAGWACTKTRQLIMNRGNTKSQLCDGWAGENFSGAAASSMISSAIDTDKDFVLSFVGQLANSTDNLTLEGYVIEVIPGF